jgi:hypothetical protein
VLCNAARSKKRRRASRERNSRPGRTPEAKPTLPPDPEWVEIP